ncbi:MAG TPA: sugar phosphate isomerase/epimerase family protein, partial [Armatimonadota bacterium]|nr:sugar phosphate isomerase/epimerase family protein [Armatimonadota bacterium]
MTTSGSSDRAEAMIGRIGFNTASLPNRPLPEAVALGAEMGFAGVELLSFADYRHSQGDLAGLYFDRITDRQREELLAMVEPFEHLSVHAPFWDIEQFSPNPGIREESRRQIGETVRVSAELGASTVTTHVSPKKSHELWEYRDEVVDYYRRLGELAGEVGITVTIETGFPVGIEPFASLIHDIGHEAVGANVDVGHLRGIMTAEQKASPEAGAIYNDLLRQHVLSLGPRLYHMHLHDIRPSDFRDHRGAGSGIIDYPALMRLMLETDYRGLMVFEIEEPDDAEQLRRSRDFL